LFGTKDVLPACARGTTCICVSAMGPRRHRRDHEAIVPGSRRDPGAALVAPAVPAA